MHFSIVTHLLYPLVVQAIQLAGLDPYHPLHTPLIFIPLSRPMSKGVSETVNVGEKGYERQTHDPPKIGPG